MTNLQLTCLLVNFLFSLIAIPSASLCITYITHKPDELEDIEACKTKKNDAIIGLVSICVLTAVIVMFELIYITK